MARRVHTIALPMLERAQVQRDAELGNVLIRRVVERRFWMAHAMLISSSIASLP